MGMFFYSNFNQKPELQAKVKKVILTRGHKNVESEPSIEGFLFHAKKILTPTVNFLRGEALGGAANDYIAGVGIYICHGKTGEGALKYIWDNLEEILKDNTIYGHWAFIVHKKGATYIFNDMTGTMRLYYYENNNKITVSTSFLSVVASLESPKFDRVRLAGFLGAKNGQEVSFVEGVEIVNPLKYFVIQDGGKIEKITRKQPDVKRVETTDEAVKYVSGLFKEQVEQLKAIGNEEVSVELSAGLDSRLIASVIKSNGFNYSFLHFPLYGPDRDVAYQIAKGLNKEIDLQTDGEKPKDYKSIFGEFDHSFSFFYHSASPRRKIKNRIQFTGAYGESIDLPELYTDEDIKLRETPILEVLIKALSFAPLDQKLFNKSLQDKWCSYMCKASKSVGIPSGVEMTENDQMNFYWYFVLFFVISRTLSAYEAHNDRYSIYSEWHFNYFIRNIAFKAKEGRKLTLALIKAIDPELANYPFISRVITARNSVNETESLPLHYKMARLGLLKQKLPCFVVELYKKYKKVCFDKDLMKAIDLDFYEPIINVKRIKKYPGVYKRVLERIYSVEVIRKELNIEM